VLFLNGLCEPTTNWQRAWIRVDDGGACYFTATIDPHTGTFRSLVFHPEA
jgi:hypothetical protein